MRPLGFPLVTGLDDTTTIRGGYDFATSWLQHYEGSKKLTCQFFVVASYGSRVTTVLPSVSETDAAIATSQLIDAVVTQVARYARA